MSDTSSRAYRKRKRAESEEETRRRITAAAVELHGTVGPAASTITAVAKLAGVSRMTVYNHFPEEVDLYRACSSDWAAQNPFPDPSEWTMSDPAERLETALAELYAWYGLKRGMLGNVMRDVPTVPALAEVMGPLWGSFMGSVVQTLRDGWPQSSVDDDEVTAMLELAVDFGTWQRFEGSGLDEEAAARLMTLMVTSAIVAGAAVEATP